MQITYIIADNADKLTEEVNDSLASYTEARVVAVYPKADRVMAWIEHSGLVHRQPGDDR